MTELSTRVGRGRWRVAARPTSRCQDYFERRVKEGKTRREIVRCLKRYAAREVFHLARPAQSCLPS
ncbi:hypothetical protein Sgleb_13780 [Streptomyces glebosus]|uniref:Transposase IS116/IS110/IS902 family protein n=1 Tax=Streptomyces glebosus TaxID=249580 RepID=A0A640SSU2_9ACTN|nr:hypothetical protein Sgleb_13780 [Streptomyces glebosus]GHG66414.1 hypothetical protein GCM10010513_35540 [Streptomyces glebosus]